MSKKAEVSMPKRKSELDKFRHAEVSSWRRDLGTRLSSAIALYGTKRAAAEVAGVTAEQLKSYEEGQAKPPFEVVVRLASGVGVRLDWLASGKGAMREADEDEETRADATPRLTVIQGGGEASAGAPDEELLAECLEVLEEELQRARRTLPTPKKAAAAALLYKIFQESKTRDRATVLRLISLAG